MRNTIALKVRLERDKEKPGEAYLDFLLTVDGEYLHEETHWVDPVDLVMSVGMSGEHYLFTCSCGDPSCVGIDEGVHVTHTEREVRWRVRNPLAFTPEEPLPDWTHYDEYVFDRHQYAEAIRAGLASAKGFARAWRGPGELWVGPDLDPDELHALEVPETFGHGMLEEDGEVIQ
jgi:hypothetical protein